MVLGSTGFGVTGYNNITPLKPVNLADFRCTWFLPQINASTATQLTQALLTPPVA